MAQNKYYSYKSFYPEKISSGTYVSPFGEIFTNLDQLSDPELEELGFILVELPEGLYKIKNQEGKYPPEEYWTQSYTWYRPTVEFIVSENDIKNIRSKINYITFWNNFSETNAYSKIRQGAMTSLPINTIATELIALFSDAKIKNVKVDRIQECLTSLFQNVEFTPEELQEIQEVFVGTGMHYQYTL